MNLASSFFALVACAGLLASSYAQPVITDVTAAGTNLTVRFTAVAGTQKLTLESSARASAVRWEPRAIRRISSGGRYEISIPLSERMELLRLRAETNDVLPSAFFSGPSEFPSQIVPFSVNTTGGGVGGTTVGATTGGPGTGGGTTAGVTGGTTAGGTTGAMTTAGTTAGSSTAGAGTSAGSTGGAPPPVSVVESDIWKVDGSNLYFFNQLRGLQKIDISGRPVLKSTYSLPGVGEQMYTLANDIIILLASGSACDASRPRILAIDMRGEPKLLWEHPLPGTILESRLIGSDLFIAVSEYRNIPGQNIWESGTTVQALDLSDPTKKTMIRELYFQGAAQAVSANDRFFFVSHSMPVTNGWVRPPTLFDFSIHAGEFTGGTFSVRLSSSTNTFDYRSPTGEWLPSGKFSWTNELELVLDFSDSGTDRITFNPGSPGYFTATYTDATGTNDYSGTYSSDSQLQQLIRSGVSLIQVASIRLPDPVIGFAETAGIAPDKFKMYENNGILSVISPSGTTYLETFALDDPAKPKPLGKVSFAQLELLYATRFVGDKAYIVTFRRTDPLWIIDLSKPESPSIVGELRVPGWSTFIEPLDDKLLTIGFGDDFGRRVAVSVFDVSNPAAPKLAAREFIGTTQSSSESTVNEKAFGFIPEAGLILVPFQEQSVSSSAENKVQLVDFAGTNLTLRGTISHELSARRSTLVGHTILSLSNRELLAVDAADRSHPEVTSALELAPPVDELIPYGDYLIEIHRGSATGNELRVTRDDQVIARYELAPNQGFTRTQVIGHLLYLLGSTPSTQFPFHLTIFDLDRLPNLTPINLPDLPFPNGLYHSTELLELAPDKVVLAAYGLLSYTGLGIPTATGNYDLTGATLQLIYPSGGGERFNFISGVNVIYESGLDVATYTYSPISGLTTIIRPGGQTYRFVLLPGATTGTTTVIYQDPNSSPESDPATYTLNPRPAYVPSPQASYSVDGSLLRGAPTYYVLNVADPAKPFVETNFTVNVLGNFSPTFVAEQKLFTSFVQSDLTAVDHHGLLQLVQRTQLSVVDLADSSQPVRRRLVDLPAPLVGISHRGSILYVSKANPTNTVERELSALAYDGTDAYLLDSVPYNVNASYPGWGDRIHIKEDLVYLLARTNNGTFFQGWQIADQPKFKSAVNLAVPEDSYDVQNISGEIAVLTVNRVLVISSEGGAIRGQLNLHPADVGCREAVGDSIVKQGDKYLAPLGDFGVHTLPLEPFN